TSAPAAAKPSAIERPIPRLPPATSTRRRLNEMCMAASRRTERRSGTPTGIMRGMEPRSKPAPQRSARRRLLAALAASAIAAASPALARDAAAAPAVGRRGKVSWYGRRFAARRTASGEAFDPDALTMAHRALPFGTLVRVTNLRNRRSVVVRVNDRGPHVGDRIADVSLGAARALGMVRSGVVEARLEPLGSPTPAR